MVVGAGQHASEHREIEIAGCLIAARIRGQRRRRVGHEKIPGRYAVTEVIEGSDGCPVVGRDDGQPSEREQSLWMSAIRAGIHRTTDVVLLTERDAVVR